MRRIFIVCQSLISAPQPIYCTSEPTELGCEWLLILHKESQCAPPFLLSFPTNGYKQKPVISPLFSYLRSQYTLFAKIPLYFPLSIYPTNTVQNYHRWLLSLYRSDQIEQMLTLYGTTRILLMTITSMMKKTYCAATTHLHDDAFFSSLFLCLQHGCHVILPIFNKHKQLTS